MLRITICVLYGRALLIRYHSTGLRLKSMALLWEWPFTWKRAPTGARVLFAMASVPVTEILLSVPSLGVTTYQGICGPPITPPFPATPPLHVCWRTTTPLPEKSSVYHRLARRYCEQTM